MPPKGKTKEDKAAIKQLKDALYTRCAQEDPEKRFSTEDLLELGVIRRNDHEMLMQCTQVLLAEGLFQVSSTVEGALFKVVRKEDAARYQNFTQEEHLVFTTIETAGRDPIWTQTIRNRTNLHLTVVNRAIKNLESKGFIKNIQNVRFPTKKMYMLAKLTPSEDVTGGPWFTDGELDTEFIERLSSLIEMYVRSRSLRRIPRHGHTSSTTSKAPTKEQGSPMQKATPKKQPKPHQVIELEEAPPPPPPAPPPDEPPATGTSPKTPTTTKRPAPSSFSTPAAKKPTVTTTTTPKSQSSIVKPQESYAHYLPQSPTFKDYPTLPDIISWLNSTRVTDTPLHEEHVKQLLDILYYDNRIERVTLDLPSPINATHPNHTNGIHSDEDEEDEEDDPDYDPKAGDKHRDENEDVLIKDPRGVQKQEMYRSTRILPIEPDPMFPGDGNPYTEVPCGRCPVFYLCEEGGPINASSCVYLKEWLEK